MATNTWESWLGTSSISVSNNTLISLQSGYNVQAAVAGLTLYDRLNMAGTADYFRALDVCPPLASVIDKLASAYANGCCEVLTRSTEKYVRGKNKAWQALIDNPNPRQTRTDFAKQLLAYATTNGWVYIQPEYPEGFTDIPSKMFIIDPEEMHVMSLRNNRFPIDDPRGWRRLFRVFQDGTRRELDESKLIMIVGNDLLTDKQTKLPISKFRSIKMPISNIVAELKARNNIITKRGALGFVANNSVDQAGAALPVRAEKKKEVEDAFTEKYGIDGEKSPVAYVSANVTWQKTGMNVQELGLHDEHKGSTADICDRLGYPFYLMGGKDGTYNNVGEAAKDLYQNTIMPIAAAIDQALNKGLNTLGYNVEIITDYSHIEALQAGKLEEYRGQMTLNQSCVILWNNGLITLNEWKLKIGDDQDEKNPLFNLTKPLYDQYLRDNGIIPQPLPNEQGKRTAA